jgi:hypothetical protein
MKSITEQEAFVISREIRDVLNRHEATKGCDAVLLAFSGDMDGLKLGHIRINDPPAPTDVIRHLSEYIALAAYDAGRVDMLKEISDRANAVLKSNPKNSAS